MAESIQELKEKLAFYEQDGIAHLYYALNRKMNEMASLLDSKNLKNVVLDDPKDKTFDRLKAIWQDAESISNAAKILGNSAGVTGDEKKDVARRPFNESFAETRH